MRAINAFANPARWRPKDSLRAAAVYEMLNSMHPLYRVRFSSISAWQSAPTTKYHQGLGVCAQALCRG
jgi:hypothetical protein